MMFCNSSEWQRYFITPPQLTAAISAIDWCTINTTLLTQQLASLLNTESLILQIMEALSGSSVKVNVTQAALAYQNLVTSFMRLLNVSSADILLSRLSDQMNDSRLQAVPALWAALQGLAPNGTNFTRFD